MKRTTKAAVTLLIAGVACCAVWAGLTIQNGGFDWNRVRALRYQETSEDKNLVYSGAGPLELDIDAAELTIKEGDSWSLTAGRSTSWGVSGDTLSIWQSSGDGWWWKSDPAPITLTVPKGSVIASMDIDVDAGSVTVQGITAAQGITCDVDAGSVQMNDMSAGRLKADCDAGEIVFSGQVTGPVELNCDVGRIDAALQEGSTVGRISGNVDAGDLDIRVNGTPCVTGENSFSSTISADIPGALGGELLTIDCNVGSVSIDIVTKAADQTTGSA